MKAAPLCAIVLLTCACTPQEVSESGTTGDCEANFDAAAFSDWAARLARKSDGQTSITYEVILPFTDAKKIENTLAELPGIEHQLTFGPDGETKATISRASVPVTVSASVSTDGIEGTTSTTYPIVEALCGATRRTGATLTKISLNSTGYHLDDGKIHAQAIP